MYELTPDCSCLALAITWEVTVSNDSVYSVLFYDTGKIKCIEWKNTAFVKLIMQESG